MTVPNRPLRKQAYRTSCWISTAHFVLGYLDAEVSLAELHHRYYHVGPDALHMMEGAGHPKTIINYYAPDTGRFADVLRVDGATKAQIIRTVTNNLRDGIPVIAGLRSRDIRGFGHAVIITGMDDKNGTVIFKDPARGTRSRAFSVDVRHESFEAFFGRFRYGKWRDAYLEVYAYCSQLVYLRGMDEMTLF